MTIEPTPSALERRGTGPLGRPVLTLTTLAALAVLVALGVWQLERRAWKAEVLRAVAAARSAPPQPLGPVLARAARGEAVDFARVSVDCPGLGGAPFLELRAIHDGRPGVRLISACALAAGPYRSILVDRGFVSGDTVARPPVRADGTVVRVIGALRAPDPPNFVTPDNRPRQNEWFWRDAEAMARALGVPEPAPVFLWSEGRAPTDFEALTPVALPTAVSNRHLEYAITWFGLAAALLAVYGAMLARGARRA